jgi:hypothetical protein
MSTCEHGGFVAYFIRAPWIPVSALRCTYRPPPPETCKPANTCAEASRVWGFLESFAPIPSDLCTPGAP